MLLNNQCWILNTKCQHLEHQFDCIFYLKSWKLQGSYKLKENQYQAQILPSEISFRNEREINQMREN